MIAVNSSGRSYFSPTARKWSLWVHILSSSLWLGSATAMMLLVIGRGRYPESAPEVYAFSYCVKLIDDYIIIATCSLSALSGLLLSWKTKWGFFNHWWIIVKLASTTVMLIIGAGFLGPSINRTESLLREVRLHPELLPGTLSGMDYQFVNSAVTSVGFAQVFVLGGVMWISIFKPWGKPIWNRRA